MSNRHVATPEQIAMQQAEALTLRVQGLTHRKIAEKLMVSPQRVQQILSKAQGELAEFSRETAEEVRRIEVERLDYIVARATEAADNAVTIKDLTAALNTLMSAASLRFDLFGLKKTTIVAGVEITISDLTADLNQRIRDTLAKEGKTIEDEVKSLS